MHLREVLEAVRDSAVHLTEAGLGLPKSNVSDIGVHDVLCAMVAQKGNSISSYFMDPDEIHDDKWDVRDVSIENHTFRAIFNVNITSGLNRRASDLLDELTYGPVIFMLLDEQEEPTDMNIDMFKKYLRR